MQNIDFTDQLTATLPGVPRDQVIKFNNSWLKVAEDGDVYIYWVAYRAMVYKVMNDEDTAWVFADPAPTLPGQPGTPWYSGWMGAVGDAEREGEVPEQRGDRYFDGIGIAKIRITNRDGGIMFKVLSDQILLNSDGYEDPRIFSLDGKVYVHSQRYQPDISRKAPPPRHSVYRGYEQQRSEFTPGDMESDDRALFVKINELEVNKSEEGEAFILGKEYFFGSNASQNIEKNYGFFFDDDRLNAVYGIAHLGQPLTIFRALQNISVLPEAENHLKVRVVRPNMVRAEDYSRDCFKTIQQYYEERIPGRSWAFFSSGGPLFQNQKTGRWQGVGHVKVDYEAIYKYIIYIGQAARVLMQVADGDTTVPMDVRTAFMSCMNDSGLFDIVKASIVREIDLFHEQFQRGSFIDLELLKGFFETLSQDFFNQSICRLVEKIFLHSGSIQVPWRGRDVKSGKRVNVQDQDIILHRHSLYLSFLYELDGRDDNYRLHRFSDAFLATDPERPHYLQFAENIAPMCDDYLMGFGEDDNRAKVLLLSNEHYEKLMRHDASNFQPHAYKFLRFNADEMVLGI